MIEIRIMELIQLKHFRELGTSKSSCGFSYSASKNCFIVGDNLGNAHLIDKEGKLVRSAISKV